ncbi:MAG: aryl-sulfate sulfotransferase [Myxococcales bacterium]|nr:aryl-sulfate sulfotransferase [Myxococcales bacterium]
MSLTVADAAGHEPWDLAPAGPQRSVMASGWLLTTQHHDDELDSVVVFDGAGRAVWTYTLDDPGQKVLRGRADQDGSAVWVSTRSDDGRLDDAWLHRVEVATGATTTWPLIDAHHDHVVHTDGSVVYLSRDRLPDRWFAGTYPLATDVVRRLDPGDGGDERLFSLLESVPVEPWYTCSHMAPGRFLPDLLDWSHANSLAVDSLGAITVGVRHFDAVVRLTPAGEVAWWMGGRFATLEPVDGAEPPRHGHFSDAWPGGLLVFDNGNHVDDAVTRLVEYAVDEEAGTYEEVWSYDHPEGLFFGAQGDAVRLPGGNVLVSWSGAQQIWEITRQGEVVWELDVPQRAFRIQFLSRWAADSP